MEIYEDEFEKEENFNSFFDFEDNDELLVHLFSKLYQSLNKEKVFIPSNKKILSQLKKKIIFKYKNIIKRRAKYSKLITRQSC